jgi:hypothetical protein
MIFAIILFLVSCAALSAQTSSNVLLNESFVNLDNWIEDINGYTGVISLIPRENTPENYVFTNITHCEPYDNGETCYRAELATLQALRPTLFPNCSVEYWLGFTSILPTTWTYDENGDSLVYNFQLHGKV